MEKTYEVTGLKCQGCVKGVSERLSAVAGVTAVAVSLENNSVTVTGDFQEKDLVSALADSKFALKV